MELDTGSDDISPTNMLKLQSSMNISNIKNAHLNNEDDRYEHILDASSE